MGEASGKHQTAGADDPGPLLAAISAIALFAVGAAVSLFTGKSAVFGGLRMLGIGAAAAIVTYLEGSVIGVSLS
ncbi:MAG: VIT1/CCC1 transporter family protein [Chloroflexota bacterium]